MANRKLTKIDLGNGTYRVIVRLHSNECQLDTLEARFEQFRFLSAISSSPDLTMCGIVPFQRMEMYHNGTEWVVDAEATVNASEWPEGN